MKTARRFTLEDINTNVDIELLKVHGFDLTGVDLKSNEYKESVMVAFIEALTINDEAFGERLEKAETIEAKYEVCSEYIDIPFDNFKDAYERMIKEIEQVMFKDNETGELSDTALDMVAGGSKAGWKKFWSDTKDAVCIVAGGAIEIVGGALAICTGGAAAPAGMMLGSFGATLLGMGIDGMRKYN